MLIPSIIIPDLRTDHAGETGAVSIYKGILLVSKDKEVILEHSRQDALLLRL